jgi:hypothetical protein
MADRPFASALGGLAIITAIASLLHENLAADVLQMLVPWWMLDAVSVMYGIGGLLLLIGIAYNRTDIEGSACVILFTGLVVRAAALITVLGFTTPVLTNELFYIIFAGACVERFIQCLRGEHIVRVSSVVTLEDVRRAVSESLQNNNDEGTSPDDD